MSGNTDLYVLLIIVILLVLWAFYGIKHMLIRRFPIHQLPHIDAAGPPSGKAVGLLEDEGYDVLCGKWRIPLNIIVSHKTLQSRLYVDYLVKGEDGLYIVKLAKDRQHIEWTGSGVRDFFLPYFSLHHRIVGVLYVDLGSKEIKKIKVDWDGD